MSGRKKFTKRLRYDTAYVAIKVLLFLVNLLPRRVGLSFFALIGHCISLIPTRDRSRSIEHLTLIFGDQWSTEKIKKTAKLVYVNICKNIFDALYLARCSDQVFNDIVKVDGYEEVTNSVKESEGAIFINGHIGCFEASVIPFAKADYNVVTIGQELYDPRVDTLVSNYRSHKNVTYLHRDGSGRAILKHLKQGDFFGVLIDQDTNVEGVFARFLGRVAYTPAAPIRLAMKFNYPLFGVYTTREKDNTHRVTVRKIDLESTGDFNRDLVFNTEKANAHLGEGILKSPSEWVWMHRRWNRTRQTEGFENKPSIEDYL